MNSVGETALRTLSFILPGGVQESLLPRFCGDLKRELSETATDKFLDSLLWGMQTAFALSRSYRKNIADFKAVFVFRTRGNHVGATAVFDKGRMNVDFEPRPVFDTRISFRDADGLRRYLLAGDQDILDTMLSDPVDVDGNLSCLYRFGFLAKELTLRLGVG